MQALLIKYRTLIFKLNIINLFWDFFDDIFLHFIHLSFDIILFYRLSFLKSLKRHYYIHKEGFFVGHEGVASDRIGIPDTDLIAIKVTIIFVLEVHNVVSVKPDFMLDLSMCIWIYSFFPKELVLDAAY